MIHMYITMDGPKGNFRIAFCTFYRTYDYKNLLKLSKYFFREIKTLFILLLALELIILTLKANIRLF